MTKTLSALLLAIAATAAIAAQSRAVPGLDVTVTKVERATSASLKDCPPGTNTVNAVVKPGEQFVLVTASFKVGAGFSADPLKGKRPTAVDAAGKKYFTPSYLVDPGSVAEYSCTFPFRVAEGTKLKTLSVESATIDLASLDK